MADIDEDLDLLEEGTEAGGDGEMFEHFSLTVDRGQAPLRIDKWLATHLEDTSRNRIQLAIKAGYVRVNGSVVKANYKVTSENVVSLVMPYRRRGVDILPENIPLNILYEDNDVLIVDKAAGMVVHPGHGHFGGTLVNALAWHFGLREEVHAGDSRMGYLVHRIDKDTSGILVVAKSDEAQFGLAKQFFDHSITRRYLALVWGNLKDDEGTIETNITRDPADRLRFKATLDPEVGKHAVTHYRVVERFGYTTLVECRLETGRTHQIRVHFNYLGHPLFGDERYDGTLIRKDTIYAKYRQFIENCLKICPRQALHARCLGFVHPVTGREVYFESPLPSDMAALLEKWRRYSGFRTDALSLDEEE